MKCLVWLCLFTSLFLGCRDKTKLPWNGLKNKAGSDVHWHLDKTDEASEWLVGESSSLARITLKSRKADLQIVSQMARDLELTLSPLYSDYVQPYPGAVTNHVKCDKEDMYTRFEIASHVPSIFGFLLYSNSRWVANGCNGTERKYLSFFGVLHCPRSGIAYNVKAYFHGHDLERAKEFIQSFECE